MPPMKVPRSTPREMPEAPDHQLQHLEPDDFVDQSRTSAPNEEEKEEREVGPRLVFWEDAGRF